MKSVQRNLVDKTTSREQNRIPLNPVGSARNSKTTPEKALSDQQAAVTKDLFAAFTWLFGSGCY
jgi:hypothetical protein